jgi:hypothetical protein
MKKLMLTTAIASVLVTSAMAQTSITGELRINYKSVSADKNQGAGITTTDGTISVYNTAVTAASQTQKAVADAIGGLAASVQGNTYSGFGTEQQINIQTKGKLNVGGIDYAAGMSIENDGDQGATLFNENVYMDFTNASSGTTISLSRDHIQRSDSDRSAAVLVGFSPNDLSQTQYSATTLFQQNIGAAPGQVYGIAVLQKTPIGTLSYNFAPNNAAPGQSEDVVNETKGAYEYGFVGDLGVKGLEAYYFRNNETDTVTSAINKAQATSWGAKYNMGQISFGYADKNYNSAGATKSETNEKHYGVAYAINNNVTVGLLYAKADVEGAANATKSTYSTGTQKVKAIQLGYALGPVDLTASYAQNSNLLGVENNDSDTAMIRFIGKF